MNTWEDNTKMDLKIYGVRVWTKFSQFRTSKSYVVSRIQKWDFQVPWKARD
jgi:hypothetical protein